MGYDRGDGFPSDFEQNGIPFGSENRKENCHHDHIPLNVKGNGNRVFSVHSIRYELNYSNRHAFLQRSSVQPYERITFFSIGGPIKDPTVYESRRKSRQQMVPSCLSGVLNNGPHYAQRHLPLGQLMSNSAAEFKKINGKKWKRSPPNSALEKFTRGQRNEKKNLQILLCVQNDLLKLVIDILTTVF